jgi:hypothetical protein
VTDEWLRYKEHVAKQLLSAPARPLYGSSIRAVIEIVFFHHAMEQAWAEMEKLRGR